MTDLEKYELVNSCGSIQELQDAILKIGEAGMIEGRKRYFDAENMANWVPAIVKENGYPNHLTRKWGIRQQALYLKEYKLF